MPQRSETPGWNAIDAALARFYPAQAPRHFAPVRPSALGGTEPLDGISVYAADRPVPHWHYVSFGFSELYEKESDDDETSGLGFELSFRLATAGDALAPPKWPIGLLQNLARFVFERGCGLAPLELIDLHGPIALNLPTQLVCAVVRPDAQLREIETPNGRLVFLQVVGLARDEYEAALDWCPAGVLDWIERLSPHGIVELSRPSLLADPQRSAAIQAEIDREGSSRDLVYLDRARWEKRGAAMRLVLPPTAVEEVRRALRGRLLHGRSFLITSRSASIALEPAESDGWRLKGELLVVSLSPRTIHEIRATLESSPGQYRWPAIEHFEIQVATA